MAHTPGPWVEDIDPDYPDDRNGWIVGVVEYAGCGSHAAEWSSEDNKRLALAAPELLEALDQLAGNAEIARFMIVDEDGVVSSALWDTIQQARAAIKKATQP